MEPIRNPIEMDPDDLGLPDPLDIPEVEMGYMVYEPPKPEEHPVIGWLVCLNGPEKGESCSLRRFRQLSIGRAEDNDMVIGHPDVEDYHAGVIYDSGNNKFFLFSDGAACLNGKSIQDSAELRHHDILQIGDRKFMFVPFCDDFFSWEAEEAFCHP